MVEPCPYLRPSLVAMGLSMLHVYAMIESSRPRTNTGGSADSEAQQRKGGGTAGGRFNVPV